MLDRMGHGGTLTAGPLLAPPRLRGMLHLGGFVVAAIAGPLLFALTGARWSVAVYAASLMAMLGISVAYHRGRWTPPVKRRWKRADHAAIGIFIAGTYTPICAIGMAAPEGPRLLAMVWAAAGLGAVRAIAWPTAPRWIAAATYVLIGWVAILALPAILHAIGPLRLGLIVAGGVCYTIGATIYAMRWPDPWPRTFGFHELFHALTLVAVVLHFGAILAIVTRR